jgi:hypothetical protein
MERTGIGAFSMKLTFLVYLAGLTLFPGVTQAEGPYGGADLSAIWQNSQTVVLGPEQSHERGTRLGGYLGYTFASGLHVEGELRFQEVSDADDALDGLRNSSFAALRAGLSRGDWTAELLAGAADMKADGGGAALSFGGIAGTYSAGNGLALHGTLLHLAKDSGEDAIDVIRDATAVTFGVNYGVGDRLTLLSEFAYADGVMDFERDNVFISEITLGATYELHPQGLSARISATYTDLYQGTEQDNAYDTRVSLGLVYRFGDKGHRAPLPDVEQWMALSAGLLE